MRVSADKSDPGFATWMAMPNRTAVRIFLDDVEQRHVYTADDVEGTVCRSVLDAEGHAQIDPDNPDQIWREVVHGVVRIEVPS
jgi:hypothetical protein